MKNFLKAFTLFLTLSISNCRDFKLKEISPFEYTFIKKVNYNFVLDHEKKLQLEKEIEKIFSKKRKNLSLNDLIIASADLVARQLEYDFIGFFEKRERSHFPLGKKITNCLDYSFLYVWIFNNLSKKAGLPYRAEGVYGNVRFFGHKITGHYWVRIIIKDKKIAEIDPILYDYFKILRVD
ncbi:MAG: hypothetical protein NZ889_00455 [Candidatus Pacearchaeota archaeon]|nr:hypothetical protein [Candidatus Pacearchaeota archaeon]